MAETTTNVTPEPPEDSLMGSAVAKKFPGFGKELWDGEIVDGPDPKGRWCVYWARDDSTTWHSRSMLEKLSLIHISEPRDKRQSRMPSSA